MKSLVSRIVLVSSLLSSLYPTINYADSGIEAYRRGNFTAASKELINTKKRNALEEYYLAQLYWYGYGILKNHILAVLHFKVAAEQGFLPAQRFMGSYSLTITKDYKDALKWYKLASTNDTQAAMYCAAAYLFGLGTPKNEDTSTRYIIQAAKANNGIAQYTLAAHFLRGRNSSNNKLGLVWLQKAVGNGNRKAMVLLAKLYAEGKLVTKSPELSKEWLDKAINGGEVSGYILQGDLYRLAHEDTKAKESYDKAISHNNTEAMLALARMYADKQSSYYNFNSAFLWFLKAAQLNNVEAEQILAKIYEEGKLIPKDPNLAKAWKDKASSDSKRAPVAAVVEFLTDGKVNNFAETSYRLGGLLNWSNDTARAAYGVNPAPQFPLVKQSELFKPSFTVIKPNEISLRDYLEKWVQFNYTKTEEKPWTPQTLSATSISPVQPNATITALETSATFGDVKAELALGQRYAQGLGVEVSFQQAKNYYEKAATQGDLKAMYLLGVLLLQGKTGELSINEGMRWLYDAAYAGSGEAQEFLGQLLSVGLKDENNKMLIQPDPKVARQFYFLASAMGSGKAQFHLAKELLNQFNIKETVAEKKNRHHLIETLLNGAVASGLKDADIYKLFFNLPSLASSESEQSFKTVQQSAEQGNKEAALLLAMMYDRGIGIKPDKSKAIAWYQKAGSNPISDFILGTYYQQGEIVKLDLPKARELLENASKQKFSDAIYNLAIIDYQEHFDFISRLNQAITLNNPHAALLLADYTISSEADTPKIEAARAIYLKMALQGVPTAQYKIGYLMMNGIGGSPDYDAGMHWYTLAASSNEPMGQYLLARAYQLGTKTQLPDYQMAKRWYLEAEKHIIPASVALGYLEETINENYEEAKQHYSMAALKGNRLGQYNLALIYDEGKGQPVDATKARELYTLAAEQNSPSAMVRLANLMFYGVGGRQETTLALDWYQKAAKLGNGEAYYQLGLLAETGVSVPLNTSQAVDDYQRAAKLGNEKAMLALARMYQVGIGVPQDKTKTEALYQQLTARGVAVAAYQLGLLVLQGQKIELNNAKKWFMQAQAQGSNQASTILSWINATYQGTNSFIQPLEQTSTYTRYQQNPVEIQYFDAISLWNQGDNAGFMGVLSQIKQVYPNYWPAKQIWEHL